MAKLSYAEMYYLTECIRKYYVFYWTIDFLMRFGRYYVSFGECPLVL